MYQWGFGGMHTKKRVLLIFHYARGVNTHYTYLQHASFHYSIKLLDNLILGNEMVKSEHGLLTTVAYQVIHIKLVD